MTTAFQPNGFQANAFQVDPVTGILYVVDENDSGSFTGSVIPLPPSPNEMDMHDGIGKEELKRIRALQKRIKKAEEARNKARIQAIKARKDAIDNLIEPKVVEKTVNTLKSVEIQKDTLVDLKEFNKAIKALERQKAELIKSIELRTEMARIQAQLAILEAKRQAEEDDMEALLLLM